MLKRSKALPLEGSVFAAFQQAYAEEEFEIADRLLSILECMAHQERPGAALAQSAVRDAYLRVAASVDVASPVRRRSSRHGQATRHGSRSS